jgi:two-component SAPR family response regulator
MIRSIIVDDERPSLDKLEKLLRDSTLAEVAGAFTEPLEALEFLKENEADAVFLDIEMPDMDGIELATRILDLREGTEIVFVTAYNQYAVEAFRLNALDYLLKPVTADRLRETLYRIREEKTAPACSGEAVVRCFGRFCILAGTQEIRFRTEKAEELLAYLIDGRGQFISRSKIMDTLWEDFDGDRAVVHFNTTLHYVKKALQPYGINISILYDRGSYRLDTRKLECDYLQFCAFTENAGAAARDNISDFEKTAELYAGEYLSGWECYWAAGKRLLLEEQFLRLLLAIAKYYKTLGDCRKAVQWLEKGLLYEPLHRELNYRMIEILLLTHEQILAMKYYELYRNGLMKKLKLEPDEGFKKLLQR